MSLLKTHVSHGTWPILTVMTSSEVREQGSFHCSMNGCSAWRITLCWQRERPASYGVQMLTIKADLVLPLLCVSKMLSQIGLDCIVSFFFGNSNQYRDAMGQSVWSFPLGSIIRARCSA